MIHATVHGFLPRHATPCIGGRSFGLERNIAGLLHDARVEQARETNSDAGSATLLAAARKWIKLHQTCARQRGSSAGSRDVKGRRASAGAEQHGGEAMVTAPSMTADVVHKPFYTHLYAQVLTAIAI